MAAFVRMYFALLLVGACVLPAVGRAEGDLPHGLTALHLAAREGDIVKVKGLVNAGADLGAKDEHGQFPLHFAAHAGHRSVVEFLITKGSGVDVKDDQGSTPLHRAAERSHKDCAELLIEMGANVKVSNRLGETPLSLAVRTHRADTDLVKLLIAKGADVNTVDKDGFTPLLGVAARGQKDVLELLIAAGADINANYNQRGTPLHSLTHFLTPGVKETAELLIAKGAEVNDTGVSGGKTPLHLSIENGNKNVFDVLVAGGADVNVKDEEHGRTALHYVAASRGWSIPEGLARDMAEQLIAKGADLEAKDTFGKTPLGAALEWGTKDMVELLVTSGAKSENRELFLVLLKSPEDFEKLSRQEKTRLLSVVAESSYRLLVSRVPEQGLRELRRSVMHINASRRWLQNTGDVMARILAIRLKHAVDTCVLNEMFRRKQPGHGRSGKIPPGEGSRDIRLLTSLLSIDEINKLEHIGFALSFNTDISVFCREKGYLAKDFVSGRVFAEAPNRLKVPVEIVSKEKGKEKRRTEKISIRHWASRTPPALVRSKKDATMFLLPMTLRAIDDAINARLLARIFTEHLGFARKLKGDDPIVESKSFENRIRQALSAEKTKRVNFQKADSTGRIVSEIKSRIREYTAKEADPDNYARSLFFDLAPFLRNQEVLPEFLRNNVDVQKEAGMSVWLKLTD